MATSPRTRCRCTHGWTPRCGEAAQQRRSVQTMVGSAAACLGWQCCWWCRCCCRHAACASMLPLEFQRFVCDSKRCCRVLAETRVCLTPPRLYALQRAERPCEGGAAGGAAAHGADQLRLHLPRPARQERDAAGRAHYWEARESRCCLQLDMRAVSVAELGLGCWGGDSALQSFVHCLATPPPCRWVRCTQRGWARTTRKH